MANQTFRNIQDNVLSLISKSDSTTRERVKNWINMGENDFVLRELWPFREVTGTLNLVVGTQEYDLSTNFSNLDEQNIISVSIQGASSGKLTYWPFNQLRADQPDFDQEGQSLPTRYYIKGGQIGFWPVPSSAYAVSIDYYKIPTVLSADADESILPLGYREALVHYALDLEHKFNTDYDLAQASQNRYEQLLAAARQNLLTQPTDNGNFKILGPADSVYWGAQSGEVR